MINFFNTPEEFINSKLNCNSWVATAVVGAAAVGGAVKAYSASSAAGAQAGAANTANQAQIAGALEGWKQIQSYYGLAQDQLNPYKQFGQTGIDTLTSKLPALTTPIPVSQEQLDLQKPIELTQEQLENTPGYQFTKTQGLKAVQNSAAARGLGTSGAALKGAATFSTGLADSTWQNVFAAEMANRQGAFGRYAQTWTQQQQGQQSAFDRLMGVINTGGSAANTGSLEATITGKAINDTFGNLGKGVASNVIGAGNATAAATNAIGGAVSDTANNIGGYIAYKGLPGATTGGSGQMPYGFTPTVGIAGNQPVPTA